MGEIVNERSRNLEKFQGVEEATLDLYTAVRNAYLQTRARAIRDVAWVFRIIITCRFADHAQFPTDCGEGGAARSSCSCVWAADICTRIRA